MSEETTQKMSSTDDLRAEMRAGFAEMNRRFDSLITQMDANSRRVKNALDEVGAQLLELRTDIRELYNRTEISR